MNYLLQWNGAAAQCALQQGAGVHGGGATRPLLDGPSTPCGRNPRAPGDTIIQHKRLINNLLIPYSPSGYKLTLEWIVTFVIAWWRPGTTLHWIYVCRWRGQWGMSAGTRTLWTNTIASWTFRSANPNPTLLALGFYCGVTQGFFFGSGFWRLVNMATKIVYTVQKLRPTQDTQSVN